MKKALGSANSFAMSQALSVCTSMPLTPLTTMIMASTTRAAERISPTKSAKPGVSMAKRVFPFRSMVTRDELIEMWRFCSSWLKSLTVFPSSTRPRRDVVPVSKSMASVSAVFPAPPWAARAKLRVFSG